MTDFHSCSYYCQRPECIKAQRDELRERLGSMTDRELVQQAFDAMTYGNAAERQTARLALRDRLAIIKNYPEKDNSNQPEQEPAPQPERHELQTKGEHPAPCARHCEANAFQIVIKNLQAQVAQPEQEPVALEDVYLTIIQWDVGGGKRSRRELARRIVAKYTTPPQRKPDYKEFMEWASSKGYDTAYAINSDNGKYIPLNPMTADLWKAWQAAHGIKGEA